MIDANRALRSWRQWSLQLTTEPVVVSALAGGQTNQTLLLDSNGRKLVLRINAANSERLGVDRQMEAAILQATAPVGLSPSVCHIDIEAGFLVTEFLPQWQPDREANSDWLAMLAERMFAIHQLEVPVAAVDYVAYTEAYIDQLRELNGRVNSGGVNNGLSKQVSQLRDRELPFVERFQRQQVKAKLCHHDPAPEHWRIQNGEPCLIDWEYAAKRDPACDLVLLCQSWQLNEAQQQQLLSAYGGGVSQQRFNEAIRVCRYIDKLWYEIQLSC